jgi:vancomycin resistance protein VanJ
VKRLGVLTRLLAVGYPLALLACVLGMRLVGEAHWLTTVLLYLPRRYFAYPLPIVIALPLVTRAPRYLLSPVLALPLLIFPLGGLAIKFPRATPGAPRLRVLSYNAAYGHFGVDRVCPEVLAQRPDVIAVQAFSPRVLEPLKACTAGFTVHVSSQFLLASRFPVRDVLVPQPLAGGVPAGFVRYTLETPIGLVDLFSTHPISPRDGIDRMRGVRPLAADAPHGDDVPAPVRENTQRRMAQVAALHAGARAAEHPVVIAGDTNLPGLSRVLAEELGGYQDGFSEAGHGFGYTFPAGHPWMRIDRVLASAELKFVRFVVGTASETTHVAVAADLERR